MNENDMTINEILEERIRDALDNLEVAQRGVDEDSYEANVKHVKDLIELNIKSNQALDERCNEINRLAFETEKMRKEIEFEEKKLNEQKKDRIFRTALGAFTTVITLAVYVHENTRGFEFEETGAISSQSFRKNFNLLRPKL